MPRSRAAIFTARFAVFAGAAAIALAIPLLGTSGVSGAEPNPGTPSTSTSTATTNGHDWIG